MPENKGDVLTLIYLTNMINAKDDTGYTPEQIVAANRKREIKNIRAGLCYVLRKNKFSYAHVGKILGGRDHASMMNAMNQFAKEPYHVQWWYKKLAEAAEPVLEQYKLVHSLQYYQDEIKKLQGELKDKIQ